MSDLQPCFQGEIMLLNWSETHNGGAKIVLQLADPSDLEKFKLMTVKKGNVAGQRMMAVFVEINEHEQPAQEPMRVSRDAALLCKSVHFQDFVESIRFFKYETAHAREEQAKQFIYDCCKITSRAELDSNNAAYKEFLKVQAGYRSYLAQNGLTA